MPAMSGLVGLQSILAGPRPHRRRQLEAGRRSEHQEDNEKPDRVVSVSAHKGLDRADHQEKRDEGHNRFAEGRDLMVGRAIAASLQTPLNLLDDWLDRRLEPLSRHVGLDRQNGQSAHEGSERSLVGDRDFVTVGIDGGAVPRYQAEQDRVAQAAGTPGEIRQFQYAQLMGVLLGRTYR
jgi:hypothetical protein